MSHNNEKTLIALKKAKTSLDKVTKMIEDGRYCIDIIQQNLAVIGLLRSANTSLLEGHVNNCIKNACFNGRKPEIEQKMDELIHIIKVAQTK